MSKYDGMSAIQLARTGGSVRVTCSSDVGQGNGGTGLACKGCWVSPAVANTEVVKMNIGAAASATLGVDLGRAFISGTTASGAVQPLWVPISDVSQLYFYSSDTDAVIDITYLLG